MNPPDDRQSRAHGVPRGLFPAPAVPARPVSAPVAALAVVLFLAAGCGAPSAANIELRKENQALREQIEALQRAHDADVASIKSFESRVGSVPTLSTDRLDKLYTVHGLKFGRLTGGADLDPAKPGDEGLQVDVVPTDQDGEPIKAAGTFVVEAFDLADKATPQVGHWEFDNAAARKAWVGEFLSYNYSLKCPWNTPPGHGELTVVVRFRDELTGREFHLQQVVQVTPPKAGAAAPDSPKAAPASPPPAKPDGSTGNVTPATPGS